MRTLLTVLIGIPVVIVVMAIAVINNQIVTVVFDPFMPETPIFSVGVPLYAVFFVGVMIGILLGGIATWFRQGRFRRAARENRREARRWHDEAERLKSETPTGVTALPAPSRRRAA